VECADRWLRFRPLQVMCDAWPAEVEARLVGSTGLLDLGQARVGTKLFRSLPATADRQVLLCTDLHAGNLWPRSANRGWSSTPSRTWATPPTMRCNTCSTARNGVTSASMSVLEYRAAPPVPASKLTLGARSGSAIVEPGRPGAPRVRDTALVPLGHPVAEFVAVLPSALSASRRPAIWRRPAASIGKADVDAVHRVVGFRRP
jgi:hypothetical protein